MEIRSAGRSCRPQIRFPPPPTERSDLVQMASGLVFLRRTREVAAAAAQDSALDSIFSAFLSEWKAEEVKDVAVSVAIWIFYT